MEKLHERNVSFPDPKIQTLNQYGAKAMETLQERNVSFGAVTERDAQIRKANLDYLAAMAAVIPSPTQNP
jgi:hypothetical protein